MKLKLDDLMCLYQLVDSQLCNVRLSCMPNTLVSYFNQLNRILSIIHADILNDTEIKKGKKNDK